MAVKFLIVFIPTCLVVAGGLWLGTDGDGLWRFLGWTIAVASGIAAFMEAGALISGLLRLGRWQSGAEQRLLELEHRDAELFAQGKSFDEVISQYSNPKH